MNILTTSKKEKWEISHGSSCMGLCELPCSSSLAPGLMRLIRLTGTLGLPNGAGQATPRRRSGGDPVTLRRRGRRTRVGWHVWSSRMVHPAVVWMAPGSVIGDVWFPGRRIWEGPRSSSSWNPSRRPEGDVVDVRQDTYEWQSPNPWRTRLIACQGVLGRKRFSEGLSFFGFSVLALRFPFIQVSAKYSAPQSSKSGSTWLRNPAPWPGGAAPLGRTDEVKRFSSYLYANCSALANENRFISQVRWWNYCVIHTQPPQLEETPTQQHLYAASAWNFPI